MNQMDPTETQLKLEDAATQMKIALANSRDIEVVRSCVNAFISHARSVTFVMQRESSGNTREEAWYAAQQEQLKNNPLMKFFNDQRVYSIHRGVVVPAVETSPAHNVRINGVLQAGTGLVTVLRFEGVEMFIPGESGNVFRMCEEYFLILKTLVQEWLKVRQGILAMPHKKAFKTNAIDSASHRLGQR